MSKLYELLGKEDGFQVKLRCDNYFDTEEYELIKQTITECGEEWKRDGCVPLEDMTALIDLVCQLAGGSSFYDEVTIQKSIDAELEIHLMIIDMLYEMNAGKNQ